MRIRAKTPLVVGAILLMVFGCCGFQLFGPASSAHTLYWHTGVVHTVAVSPDESLLASGGSDGELRLYSLTRMSEWKTIKIIGVCTLARFSGNGAYLGFLTGNEKKSEFHVIEAGDGKIVSTIDLQKHFANSFCFMDNLGNVAIATDGDVSLVNFWKPGDRKTLKTDCDNIHTLTCSKDGRWLAAATWCDHVLVWDLNSMKLRRKFTPGHIARSGIMFGPDQRLLVIMSNKIIHVECEKEMEHEIATFSGSSNLTSATMPSREEITFALPAPISPMHSYFWGGRVDLLNLDDKSHRTVFNFRRAAISEHVLLSDNRHLIAGLYDGRVVMGELAR